ncbi:MAG: hypothetical protein ABR499_10995 [Gemmatimonadaceae bacterium]
MRYTVPGIAALCGFVAGCESDLTRPIAAPPADTEPTPAASAAPTQSAADEIAANIQRLHLPAEFPFAAIVDPRFGSGDPASPDYTTVVGYAHAGDAAIWTGHYLAAEAFRYAVTRSPEALNNVRRAITGIHGLVDVTADAMAHSPPQVLVKRGLLARFLWPDSWWYSTNMAREERGHGVYQGTPGGVPHQWLGNTTRDQYSGVFFGLAVAFDVVDNEATRSQIAQLITTMLDFLIGNGWSVPMPNGRHSTTFLQRPDQQLTLLQIGRRVNPAAFEAKYIALRAAESHTVPIPIAIECGDEHGSYFKFNLNHINLFNLVRLEEPGVPRTQYLQAFAALRGCTGGHENAHFNMIERAVKGPDAMRDRQTQRYLKLWLKRPRRDYYVDLSGTYPACGADRACEVIPIDERVNTDFLWRRSPVLLFPDRRGEGTIETPAIDYLLPYWMGRYYGVITR